MSVATIDIAWAAGFLEGEGWFGNNNGAPLVVAAQVQKEPIERIQRIFGGNVSLKTPKPPSQPIWYWRPGSRRSVEIMMTVYVLMSPKRRTEIEAALERWKKSRLMKVKGSDVCARGHMISGYNAYNSGGRIYCRECKNLVKRLRRAGLPSNAYSDHRGGFEF